MEGVEIIENQTIVKLCNQVDFRAAPEMFLTVKHKRHRLTKPFH